MPTIRQLIQTSPAKATELFARLAETSGNAVKTRERVFAELKEELELQMRLEEQHLFPVLRKRKETKDLVSEALNDNKRLEKRSVEHRQAERTHQQDRRPPLKQGLPVREELVSEGHAEDCDRHHPAQAREGHRRDLADSKAARDRVAAPHQHGEREKEVGPAG